MKRAAFIIALFLCCSPFFLTADVSGYLKATPVIVDAPITGNSGTYLDMLFHIVISHDIAENVVGELAYELSPLLQTSKSNTSALLITPRPQSYRIADLDDIFCSSGDLQVHHNLDRAQVAWYLPNADITVGRQAIAFGSARIVNPTDIIVPFTFDSLNTEERIGVDALRIIYPIGPLSEIEGGIIFSHNFAVKSSAFFLKGRTNVHNNDITSTLTHFHKNTLLGIDLQGPLFLAGYWFEAAYTFAEQSGDDYLRLSCGLDYTITDATYLYGEYHYNGAGGTSYDDYDNVVTSTGYTHGGVYLLGQHYFFPGVVYQLTPLWALDGKALININDRSMSLSLSMEYNVSDDWYLAASIFRSIGRARSEFSQYPDLLFFSIKRYF